jgi:dsRNA-specific ribonuclease
MNTVDIDGAKNRLQEYCQQRYLPLPVYYTLEKNGPDHSPMFQVRSDIRN